MAVFPMVWATSEEILFFVVSFDAVVAVDSVFVPASFLLLSLFEQERRKPAISKTNVCFCIV
jgi:hypothetical protein